MQFYEPMDSKHKITKLSPIKILGEMIDPDNMPILYNWAKMNPETLERQLKSIADVWHEGDISSAMIAFEMDLVHG